MNPKGRIQPPSTTTMTGWITGDNILAALVSGEIDDGTVIAAVNEYRRRDRATKLMAARSTLKFGTRCTVDGIRPKRLNGTIGTIKMLTQTRADLTVESSPDWKYAKGDTVRGIPLVCLTPIEEPIILAK